MARGRGRLIRSGEGDEETEIGDTAVPDERVWEAGGGVTGVRLL